MQTLETFSVITVQVRIFSGLDRNDLKYSLRFCEIFLFMNTKVLFLVICLAFTILYVTRHLVIYEGLCVIFGRSRHEKYKKNIKRKKNPELNSVPHGPSNKLNNVSTISALNNFDRALFRADGRRFFSTIIVQGFSGAPKMADGRRWARNAHWVGQIL